MGTNFKGADHFDRHWRLWVTLFWLGTAAAFVYARWNHIGWFALGDTDDNLRMMQVRALLAGQDWFDLRQHRLDPRYGADIHWSRLVDLPLAGLMLLFRLFMSGAEAEKAAVAIAPLLPMGVAMASLALVCRRLIAPLAYIFALLLLLYAHSAKGMWMPLRIDHHGWQLAMLGLLLVGLTDAKRARGGAVTGIATALSLSIGLEMLIYLAIAGAATALMWIRDGGQARRLAAYGASLAGGTGLGYLLFASEANRAPVCDALSPVWLSVMAAAGALAVLLAWLRLERPLARLAVAAVGGAVLAGSFALAWPHCLSRPEGVSPELYKMWLSHVREARPIYTHSWQTIVNGLALPFAGLVGYGATIWRLRHDEAALTPWAAIALPALIAAALLFWQTRATPAAQLLAIPGAAALAWMAIGWAWSIPNLALRFAAAFGAFLLISGIAAQSAVRAFPEPVSNRMKAVRAANAQCPTLAALRPVALQPKGYVLTHVDLGPRLVTVTHHDAVAGPYHRNEDGILDVMHAFRGSADDASGIVMRRSIDYVLICPNLSESTIYSSRAPKGFYVQLSRGHVPDWLEPIELPENSPYKMWRVVRR